MQRFAHDDNHASQELASSTIAKGTQGPDEVARNSTARWTSQHDVAAAHSRRILARRMRRASPRWASPRLATSNTPGQAFANHVPVMAQARCHGRRRKRPAPPPPPPPPPPSAAFRLVTTLHLARAESQRSR